MSVPTNADIHTFLDQLDRGKCADDLETYWFDFKPFRDPKEEKKVAIEYAACFANADGGVVVFGVSDKDRGRAKAIHGSGNVDLAEWERAVYQATTPSLRVELGELAVPEGTGRVLVMRVPKGDSPPYGTSQGLFKKRVSTNCMPLDPQEFARSRVSTGAVDWAGEPAEGVTVHDLDPTEIDRAKTLLRTLRPTSELTRVADADFLAGLRAFRGGRVTRTGLLLFGRPEALSRECPQHLVQYVHQPSATDIARNEPMRVGLLNVLDQVERAFTGPANPEQELSVGLLKFRIPAFPLEVVREAVLNAVTHRDYTNPDRVLVRHAGRELVVSSPGGFIDGITPQNILRHESATRNPTLAQAFVKLGLVEQAGVGRRRIFIPLLSYGKRMPEYQSTGDRVTLTIYDGGFDARMARLVAEWRRAGRDIDLDGLLILTYLREHAFINTPAAAELLQLPRTIARGLLDLFAQPGTGFLERRGRTAAATFHLTKAVAKDLLGKAAYTKTKGIDPIRYGEMVRAFIEDHGSITPQECRELLGLGGSPSAKVEVSRLLKRWRGAGGFLRREGQPPKVRYYPLVSS